MGRVGHGAGPGGLNPAPPSQLEPLLQPETRENAEIAGDVEEQSDDSV